MLRRRHDDFIVALHDVGEGRAEGSGRKLEAGVDGTGVEEMPDNSRSLLIIAYLELYGCLHCWWRSGIVDVFPVRR